MRTLYATTLATALLAGVSMSAALAADTVRFATGPAGNWDTLIVDIGVEAGIFEDYDIVVEPFYTEGSGQTVQAVLSGSVDIGSAAGTLGVMSAFVQGAPIRIVGAQATGAANFWYVREDSPIQTMADVPPGGTIGYSTAGASTEIFALNFIDAYDLDAETVATGSPVSTLTQVMTGQIDVGWSSPPIGFEQVDRSEIRIIARANDLDRIRNQSIRTIVSSVSFIEQNPELLERFLNAYADTVEWLYESDEGLEIYARLTDSDVETGASVREVFDPSVVDPFNFSGIELLQEDALAFGFLDEPLTEEQIEDLVRIPERR